MKKLLLTVLTFSALIPAIADPAAAAAPYSPAAAAEAVDESAVWDEVRRMDIADDAADAPEGVAARIQALKDLLPSNNIGKAIVDSIDSGKSVEKSQAENMRQSSEAFMDLITRSDSFLNEALDLERRYPSSETALILEFYYTVKAALYKRAHEKRAEENLRRSQQKVENTANALVAKFGKKAAQIYVEEMRRSFRPEYLAANWPELVR